ncbi:MAG: UDP-glucose 4-epimerase [Chlamydiia bacterium]|nr:UDP-glucose 4-epimerase [Chlamydiia bacterium]
MRVLVTGGAGFIGKQVCVALCDAGHSPLVIDNRKSPDIDRLGFPFFHGDLGDRHFLRQVFDQEKVDGVIHLAALVNVGDSVKEPALYYWNNVGTTLNLLDVMNEHGVNRLIFSSTSALYGGGEKERYAETDPPNPISPYGKGKWMCEQAIEECCRLSGLHATVFRFFNVAGGDPVNGLAPDLDRAHHLIAECLRVALTGEGKLQVFGDDYDTHDGTGLRDYVDVRDIARAHVVGLEFLEKSEVRYELFNLGTGREHSVYDVIGVVEKVTGKKLPIEVVARREGDAVRAVSDARKAERVMGWTAQYPDLRDIVKGAWFAIS